MKSCLPSLLKSPRAMDRGREPVLTLVEPLKLPAPSPNRIETLLEKLLATAKSCLPSLLKSPIAMDAGRAPTLTSGALLKLPAPSPNRIQTLFENETLFEVALAMAKSCLPSLLKSPTTTEAPGPTLISGALLKLPAP